MEDKYKLNEESKEVLRYLYQKATNVSDGVWNKNPIEIAYRFGQFIQEFTRLISEMNVPKK